VVNSLIRESIDACSAGGCVNEDGGAAQVATLTVDAGARFWIAKKKPQSDAVIEIAVLETKSKKLRNPSTVP
jgi:hypothetical protein